MYIEIFIHLRGSFLLAITTARQGIACVNGQHAVSVQGTRVQTSHAVAEPSITYVVVEWIRPLAMEDCEFNSQCHHGAMGSCARPIIINFNCSVISCWNNMSICF